MATLTVTVPDNSQNIEYTATIKAPIEKVFEAHTKAELFKQWWARGNDLTIKAFEARDGGTWHVLEKDKNGNWEFFGTFHEVVKNERIIQTFEFLGMPERGHVALERADFVEVEPGVTEVRGLSTYQTIEDRDGMVQGGMEAGFRESIEALGRLVEE